MTGNEILKDILSQVNAKDESFDFQDINFENGTLKAILSKIEVDPKYLETFLLDLEDKILMSLIATIDPVTDQESFKTSILFIRDYIKSCKEAGFSYTLDNNQQGDLYKLQTLIQKKIQINDHKIETAKTANLDSKEITILKDKFENGTLISSEDYEAIEKIIKSFGSAYGIDAWDKVVTYLNDYNAPLIKAKLEAVKHEEQKDLIIEDVFAHHNLAAKREPKIELKSKLAIYEKRQKAKEIMAYLGYNFDDLDAFCQDKLMNSNLSLTEKTANYIVKQGIKNYLKSSNIRGLISLLTDSNSSLLSESLNTMKNDYGLDEKDIRVLMACASSVFCENGYHNFLENISLLNKYQISLRDMLYKCPSFFMDSAFEHKTNCDLLEKAGLPVNEIISKCYSKMNIGFKQVMNNYDALNKYGFDTKQITSKSASILASNYLPDILDELIELDLNEYLNNPGSNSLENLKALIIKRIFYANKNELPVWHILGLNNDNATGEFKREENVEYNEIIKSKAKPLSDEEVNQLISQYPLLTSSLAAHEIDNNKTNLVFNQTIISKFKTYRVFKCLVKAGISEREALFYALTYNSDLTEGEYNALKTPIYGMKMGAKVA